MTKDSSVICDGFTVLPVKMQMSSPENHYFFLKEHSVRGTDEGKPKHRTLFVLNVPPYVNQACLSRLFKGCGRIDNMIIQDKPTTGMPDQTPRHEALFKKPTIDAGYKVAYIIFKLKAGLRRALALSYADSRILFDEENKPVTGIRKWTSEYTKNLLTDDELQTSIDTFMKSYDEKIEEEKLREKESEGVADDEGWVTVSKHGKNKGVPRTEAHEQRAVGKESKKREKKELLNFYAFQMRETKREHIANLRKKFEEDKQRIALMKAARKFRPY